MLNRMFGSAGHAECCGRVWCACEYFHSVESMKHHRMNLLFIYSLWSVLESEWTARHASCLLAPRNPFTIAAVIALVLQFNRECFCSWILVTIYMPISFYLTIYSDKKNWTALSRKKIMSSSIRIPEKFLYYSSTIGGKRALYIIPIYCKFICVQKRWRPRQRSRICVKPQWNRW